MSVPTRSTRNGAMPRGARMNSKPAIVAIAVFSAFVLALVFAHKQRTAPTEVYAEGGRVFNIETETEETVDFLVDKPDGLTGVNRNDIGEPPETDTKRQSTLEDDVAKALERQQLADMERNNRIRTQVQEEQLRKYEEALQSPMTVSGFGQGTDRYQERQEELKAARERRQRVEQGPDVIIPAAATGLPVVATQAPPMGAANSALSQEQVTALASSPVGQQLMQALSGNTGSPGGTASQSSTNVAGVSQSNQFIAQASQGRPFTLYEDVQSPRTPYEIKTGALISGAMISAANSDLPGDIVAQVTKNVYDSASGRYVLIPQGTKLFGKYDAYTQLGQERLVIVWDRLVFEDGQTLDIGGMQGYDQRGLAGFKDKVRTHFLNTLANAFLISVVNASGDALVDEASNNGGSNITLNLAQNFSDTTSNAFNDYLRNRLKIKPTLEIRAGYQFNIVVSKDIAFMRPFERGFKAYNSRG